MDWFLYDNGLRHERAKFTFSDFLLKALSHQNVIKNALKKYAWLSGD